MAKLARVLFSALLLGVWACRDTTHALEDTETPAHPPDSPTHAHTLGRWAVASGRNLSCGSLDEAVRLAKITVDFIDEFKDDYTHAALGDLSWDEMNELVPPTYDLSSIQVCLENNNACLPVLPKLPTPPYDTPTTEGQTKALMVMVMGFLLRYSVAAETLVLDQSLSEDPYGFLDEMADLQVSLADLTEAFSIPMTSCNLTADPGLVMDLAVRLHQKVDSLQGDMRGFTGLRQIRLGLQYIVAVFSEPTRDSTRP